MSSFCISHFLSKNISVYAIFNDQSFNGMLTNDIVSFEQLHPDVETHQQEVKMFKGLDKYAKTLNVSLYLW